MANFCNLSYCVPRRAFWPFFEGLLRMHWGDIQEPCLAAFSLLRAFLVVLLLPPDIDRLVFMVFIESMNHYHLLTSWIAHRCVLSKSRPVISSEKNRMTKKYFEFSPFAQIKQNLCQWNLGKFSISVSHGSGESLNYHRTRSNQNVPLWIGQPRLMTNAHLSLIQFQLLLFDQLAFTTTIN